MMRPGKWRQIAAHVIYEGYPDQDLLPIDPPQPGETISAFAVRAQEAGDTLFLFLCREAGDDCGDAAEYVARLDRAIKDIEHVRDTLARPGRTSATPSKRTPRSTRSDARGRT
jgi:hypothetical protein